MKLIVVVLCLISALFANASDPAPSLVRIGVLAHRGVDNTLIQWQPLATYLSSKLPHYRFEIRPFVFDALQEAVFKQELDFVITNPFCYVQLVHKHSLNRIATLNNRYKQRYYNHFGSVIFTRADNPRIHTTEALRHATIAAVDADSFGGFIMAKKELGNPKYLEKTTFLKTHDAVVDAVEKGAFDVGIVRTDILERLNDAKMISLENFRILSPKHHPDFPFVHSTELYPEWPFATLAHTPKALTSAVLIALLQSGLEANNLVPFQWEAPLDYAALTHLLKELRIAPFDTLKPSFTEVLLEYRYPFLLLALLFGTGSWSLWHIRTLNHRLRRKAQTIAQFNATLETEVKERTLELHTLNQTLKTLANTDELTQIANRRHFFEIANLYFHTAKRHGLKLYLLSLDIDFFKKVNDTYGHLIGDEVLNHLCKIIKTHLRSDDLFGRVGGEEFSICVQHSDPEGILAFAQKIRSSVEMSPWVDGEGRAIAITISIGIASMRSEDKSLMAILENADKALYLAKNSGRNCVKMDAPPTLPTPPLSSASPL